MFPTAHGVVSQGVEGTAPEPVTAGGPAVYLFSAGDVGTVTNNAGWKFTVGAEPVTVTELGLYSPTGTQEETVYLYRESDGQLLASAFVSATTGWGFESVPPVILSANTTYMVSRWAGGQSRAVAGNGAPSVDPAITYVGSHLGNTADMPTGGTAHAWQAVSFRTAAPETGQRFYRLDQILNNGATFMGLHTFGLLETVSGPDVAPTSGGAPSGGGFSNPERAFDANAATGASTTSPTGDEFLIWDFGSGNAREIVAYQIGSYHSASSVATRSLNSWRVSASNDFVTWDVLDVVTGETGWTASELREFTF